MKIIGVAVFGAVFCTVLTASLKVKEEHKIAFFGEDVHIPLPSLVSTDVLFKPTSNPTAEVVLMRDGRVVSHRAQLNSLKHLILEDVGEEDEGMYVIKNTEVPADVKHIILLVRDCALEQVVKYGETYHIPLSDILGPITLEFRSSQAQVNQTTEPPAVVLLNQTSIPAEEYKGRLSVSEKRVTLSMVRGTDEGSFTVLDRDGKVRRRSCLNVKEHQNFVHLSYGSTLKINLFVDHTKVNLMYTPDWDRKERVILEHGELVVPVDPSLDGRLTVEGSMCILERVRVSDMGLFRVTDLLGFPVTNIYLEVEAYKLPTLYVAILSLLGLLVLLLLVCLLSCLINVRRRAEKARQIALIAQQADKGDGDAFVKGLEVSKAGRYHTFSSDKNFLEMSDSGVEFNSSALPLDSECETDIPQTFTSHKLLLDNSDSVAATIIPEGDQSANRTPDSAMSPSPVTQAQSEADAPEEDLMGVTTPKMASRGAELAISPSVPNATAESTTA
ncbi:unnamed protein product [Coregonus sp. 'balchen']|nr:unnamed protein product [Coregonus sp. 'balchen']